jgi:hypothetical protein
MLEIFLLIFIGKQLSKMAKAKGHSGAWAALGVLGWFGGEIVGFLMGAAMGLDLGAYVAALVCAAMGAAIGFVVVSSLPDHNAGLELDEMAETFR